MFNFTKIEKNVAKHINRNYIIKDDINFSLKGGKMKEISIVFVISTSVISNTNPISVTTTAPIAASSVKLGSSASATPIQTLRIPTIPAVSTLRAGSPQVISAPHVLHGTRTNVTLPRGPGQPALAVAVPKSVPGAMSNLAVVHQVPQVGGNKVTVLQQGANIISRGKATTFQTTGKKIPLIKHY